MDALPTSADELIEKFHDLPTSMQDFYHGMFERLLIEDGVDYTPALAEKLHRTGENLLALLVIERAGPNEDDLIAEAALYQEFLLTKLKVLHALHSYGRARRLAERVQDSLDITSLQITGNLASIIKSQALSRNDDDQRQQLLQLSLDLYGQVFSEPLFEGSYWLGVNALALATCLGEKEYVQRHLDTVRRDCLSASNSNANPDFWTLATVAELDLIELLNSDEVDPEQIGGMLASYGRAEELCETLQQRKSARKNTGLLLSYLAKKEPERAKALQTAINKKLRPARVALFSGHRIDAPDRPKERFPPGRVPYCQQALSEFIEAQNIDIGYSSAANGGDLIFVDELLKQKRAAHVILPFAEEQFRNTTLAVSGDGEDEWTERFDHVVSGEREGAVLWHASQSTVDAAGMDPYYAHTNRVILGMGRLKARELDGELVALAVMDPATDKSIGGTQAAVTEWQSQNIPSALWAPMEGSWRDGKQYQPPSDEEKSAQDVDALTQSLQGFDPTKAFVVNRTLLFADVMGFSGFSDSQVAGFCEGVLGAVNELVETSNSPPVELNTWGDGLFMVFETAVAGANFALRLCELMKNGNREDKWQQYGLPAELFMRVSLHSSPVRQLQNPLTLKSSHWGHNVSIAARIEPITPPNQVYGSAATAALIAADGAKHLAADFVGMVPLAKNFGTLELFRIHPAGSQ